MADALATLLRSTQSYMILIERSKVDWGTGHSRASKIVLRENDPLDLILKDEIDAELRRARHISLVLTDTDGGTCQIDMTHRLVQIWQDSAGTRNRIAEFNEKLLEGAVSGIVSFATIAFLLILPPVLAFCGFIAWGISDPRIRHQLFATSTPIPSSMEPAWLNDYGIAFIAYIWPLSAFAGIIISGIVLSSGCLRMWPQSLTLKSGIRLFSSIRATLFTREIATATIVAVITAVVTAIVTLIFARI